MRNVRPENYQFRDVAPPVQGTRGHQLAMYVVYQNHLPMMADYPEAYRNQAGLEFLLQVPANWDETRVLHAKLGECLVIARRKGGTWYLGGMTASKQQEIDLPLDFLGKGTFRAEFYLDDPTKGPTSVVCPEQMVSSADALKIVMSQSGGFAARIETASD